MRCKPALCGHASEGLVVQAWWCRPGSEGWLTREGWVSAQTTARHDAASPPNTEEPGEFRRRLLDGMAAAIHERGFRESTIADVVRHARTSRRTFYEHFASKQACFIALLQESNAEMVRQAIEAWLACAQSQPTLTLSWIREVPSLGDDARQLQREVLEAFVVLIQTLTDTPELRAAGIVPPPRQFSIMLLAGLRELIAITVEDGGDVADITEVAVEATMAMLGPR